MVWAGRTRNGPRRGGLSADEIAHPRRLAGSLTDCEAQVLACLGKGLSNAQIAARLYLSEARVKGCVSRMPGKLGCANCARAWPARPRRPGIVSP